MEWTIIGSIAGVISAFFAILSYLRGWWPWKRKQPSHIQQAQDDIVVTFDSEIRGLEIFVQTFRQVGSRTQSSDGLEENQKFPMEKRGSSFMISKSELKLEEGGFYKLFAKVPNEGRRKNACYAALCRNGYVVTGTGTVNSDNQNYFNIWFLVANEKITLNPLNVMFINHVFEDRRRN